MKLQKKKSFIDIRYHPSVESTKLDPILLRVDKFVKKLRIKKSFWNLKGFSAC